MARFPLPTKKKNCFVGVSWNKLTVYTSWRVRHSPRQRKMGKLEGQPGFFSLTAAPSLRKGKLWIQTNCTPVKDWPSVTSWWRGWVHEEASISAYTHLLEWLWYQLINPALCVCEWERERERESVSVCAYVCVCVCVCVCANFVKYDRPVRLTLWTLKSWV